MFDDYVSAIWLNLHNLYLFWFIKKIIAYVMVIFYIICQKFNIYCSYKHGFQTRTGPVRSDQDNRKPLTNTVLLTTRTVLCIKSTKPFEPRLNHPDLRTVNGSHGSDQRLKKKKKKLQAHSTLSPWLKLQPL